MPKIQLVLTGIGNPNYETKIQLLKKNLNKIISTKGSFRIDLFVSIYTQDVEFPEDEIKSMLMDGKLNIIREQNYIGEFIYKYIKPRNKYMYVILMLDDVEIKGHFSLNNIINSYKKTNNIKIFSPVLTTDSVSAHTHMIVDNTFKETKKYVDFCELFFYLMDKKTYNIYYNIISSYPEYTKYMWGVDLLLSKYGIQSVLINRFRVKHLYSNINGNESYKCMCTLLNLHNVINTITFN